MRVNWTYTGCDKSEQEQLAEAWQARQAEIADFQDRSESDVHKDLVVAEATVRHTFRDQHLLDIEEQLERKDLARPHRSHRS